jgi:glutamine kinase
MGNDFYLGTKAETLERIHNKISLSSTAEVYFFEVNNWLASAKGIVSEIQKKFPQQMLAIRSSAQNEDTATSSMAGCYTSKLNVASGDSETLAEAIREVIRSYAGNPKDQVLVQPMIKDIAVSGVITNFELNTGAPYYVINYDDLSGKTDTITGGTGVNKTVLIHRDFKKSMPSSTRVLAWVEFVQELELLLPNVAMDIEFAQTTDGKIYLLQLRRIAVEKNWNLKIREQVSEQMQKLEQDLLKWSQPRSNLYGRKTVLGEMPDWNPAEIIGTRPRTLASSLYKFLVTDDVWRRARAAIGYYHPEDEKLMVQIAGRPFIDTRCSFNSFLPANLSPLIAEKIVNLWIDRLVKQPELHDKIEFEIAHTALDFDFDQSFSERYSDTLAPEELLDYKSCLQTLTVSLLRIEDSPLKENLAKIEQLAQSQKKQVLTSKIETAQSIADIKALLDECKELGTLPFAIIARLAFIAENLLRSCVKRGVLAPERLNLFKTSLQTVTSQMSDDFKKVALDPTFKANFLDRYGHLRPGTYDILSLRYDQRPDLFMIDAENTEPKNHVEFELTKTESLQIDTLLKEFGASQLNARALFEFCHNAIAGREYAKFVFTKNLSNALEMIADLGKSLDISREDMSHISIDDIFFLSKETADQTKRRMHQLIDENRRQMEQNSIFMLSYLIRDVKDLYVVPLHRSAPNYISTKRIEGRCVQINSRMIDYPELTGKIVCIENADPGFDWIFTRNIAGLITQFGGSNSHMAIRCAEFDLPAAIGCGEQTFQRIVQAGCVELNCAEKILRPIHE